MKTVLNLEINLSLIDGDEKREIERYIDSRLIRQRKSYDEYYVDTSEETITAGINDLMSLGEKFKVTVLSDSVHLTHLR